jgi:hypothetical protein
MAGGDISGRRLAAAAKEESNTLTFFLENFKVS